MDRKTMDRYMARGWRPLALPACVKRPVKDGERPPVVWVMARIYPL